MFDFHRQKEPRKVRAESDLKAFEAEDQYQRKKLLLDVASYVGVAVLVGGVIFLLLEIIVDLDVRKRVLDLLVSNIAGIIYAGLIIFGLKPKNKM